MRHRLLLLLLLALVGSIFLVVPVHAQGDSQWKRSLDVQVPLTSRNQQVQTSSQPAQSVSTGATNITFAGVVLTVELATTSAEQQQGLRNRSSMPANHGMLFIFSQESEWGMWMYQMEFPLDMIWFNANRQAVFIEQNLPPCTTQEQECPTYTPNAYAMYVLAVNAGFVQTYGVTLGETFTFQGDEAMSISNLQYTSKIAVNKPLTVSFKISYFDGNYYDYLVTGITSSASFANGYVVSSSPQSCQPSTHAPYNNEAYCYFQLSAAQGSENVEFSLSGLPPGTYSFNARAILAYFSSACSSNDDVCIDADSGPTPFSFSVVNQFALTVNAPDQVPVTIDDAEQGTGTISQQLFPGLHSISVPDTVSINSISRLAFVGWSDGSNETTRMFVLGGNSKISANYVIQYLVSATTDSTVPPGWYDSGTVVQFSVNQAKWLNRYCTFLGGFGGWYNNGQLISKPNAATITINGPVNLTAKWNYLPSYLTILLLPVCSVITIIVYRRSGIRVSHTRTVNENVAWHSTIGGVPIGDIRDPVTGEAFEEGEVIWQCLNCSAIYHTQSREFINDENDARCVACLERNQIFRFQSGRGAARWIERVQFRPELITIDDVNQNVGRIVSFEGRVVEVEQGRTGAYTIKFERGPRASVFKLAISRRYISRFSRGSITIRSYQDHTIRVRGLIQKHSRHGLQILVNSEAMIQVVD